MKFVVFALVLSAALCSARVVQDPTALQPNDGSTPSDTPPSASGDAPTDPQAPAATTQETAPPPTAAPTGEQQQAAAAVTDEKSPFFIPPAPTCPAKNAKSAEFRTKMGELLDSWKGEVENSNSKFDVLFPQNTLNPRRLKSKAEEGKTYSTCIDTMMRAIGDASKETGVSTSVLINNNLSTRQTRGGMKLPACAWHEIIRGLLVQPQFVGNTTIVKSGFGGTYPPNGPTKWPGPEAGTIYVDPRQPGSPRPKKGDIMIFVFKTPQLKKGCTDVNKPECHHIPAGGFSHVSMFHEIIQCPDSMSESDRDVCQEKYCQRAVPAKPNCEIQNDEELWISVDGGQGTVGVFSDAQIATAKASKKYDGVTPATPGKEAILEVARHYRVSDNTILGGEANQSGSGDRVLLGWLDVEAALKV